MTNETWEAICGMIAIISYLPIMLAIIMIAAKLRGDDDD